MAQSLLSPIGGVVSYIRPYDHGTPAGGGEHAPVVQVASAGHGRHPEHSPLLGGIGVGATDDAASHDALRRALALYAAASWDASDMRWASADELGDEAIAIEELARMSPIETRDRIRWVEGFALDDGRPTWVPAVLAHVSLPVAVEAETFWPASVAGLAVADGLGAAVLDGLLDCIARDALAVARARNATLAKLGDDSGVAVFDATSDLGVPCAVAQGRASFEVGVAAAPTLDQAQQLAVEDLWRRRTRRALAAYPDEPAPDPAFAPPIDGMVAPAASDEPIDLSKPAIVARLRRVGLSGFAVDLTTDELRDAEMAAVRVIVPGLSPVQPTPGWADHARLARVTS